MKLGEKIKYYREKRGYNLSALAQKAGIAKSTLHKIEENKTNPTINTLWAIATILEIPFGELVSKDYEIKEDNLSIVLIEKNEEIEVYKMILLNNATYVSQAHFNGVIEQIYVIKGSVLIGEIQNPKVLTVRETIKFKADVPHIYKSLETETVLIVTIFYPKNYEKYFYEDRFVKEFNQNYLKELKRELINGLDTIRIIPKSIDFNFNTIEKNIQIIRNNNSIFISNISKNNLQEIKKYLLDKNTNLLNIAMQNNFSSKLLKNEISIINQEAKNYIDIKNFKSNLQNLDNNNTSEKQVNLNLYDYFKYFHPGYTLGNLLISSFIKQFPKQKILDISPNFRKHLNLINEFTENKFIFDYTDENFKNLISNQYNILLSVDSLHNMDLYEFLENSYNLLKDNGYLIICNEFITKFNTKKQREKALILHHTFYMLKVMFPIDLDKLTKQEKIIYNAIREYIPYARYLALNNEITLAKNILNQLFNKIKNLYLKEIKNNLIAYYLFIAYELETLIAGLDYKKIQKTYANNLINIAKKIGFENILNFNFYPTYNDSGTYLIILKKNK